jgi:multiple sugar transport system ATP-binding protein
MADKMAVMSGGFLQQYDAPAAVFANPVNTFVAGFVGSPAMNLVPLDVVRDGETVSLRSPDGWTLPLSPENGRKALSARSPKVVLGARHSTMELHKSAVPGAVPGRVYIVEPTGDITYAQVRLGENATVIVSVEPTVTLAPDELVWIGFDQQKIHLFDGETQMALAAA